MAITCSICYAWQPCQWEVWRYTDTVAKCRVKDTFTTSKETCEHASITGRANAVKSQCRPKAIIQASSSTASVSSRWDDFTEQATYKHQQEAIDYFDDKTEIALFFEMGTGKSRTVLEIAANKFKRKEIDALLIIAPNDVHVQWYKEQLVLWLNVPYDVQCLFGRGGTKQAYPFIDDPETLQVVSVNVDTFSTPKKWRDIVDWANAKKTMIILDEATSIKNPSSQRSQHILYEFNSTLKKGKSIIASQPRSVARAILTGTPVTNGTTDLWPIFEFLRPNYFGRNWYSFKNHYGMFTKMAIEDGGGNVRQIDIPLTEEWWNSIKKIKSYEEAVAICGCSVDTFNEIHKQDYYEGPYKHADELRKLIEPVSRFKLLKDCVDMPEQIYITRQLVMTDALAECYKSMVDELIAEYENHTMVALNKIGAMVRLQQISSGFIYDKTKIEEVDESNKPEDIVSNLYGLDDDDDITPEDPVQWIGTSNPKLDALYRDVEEAAKPVIVVTRFTAEASRIYNDLASKYKCCLITGWKRVGTIDEFKEGKYQVMVANIAAISHGFNLQNSHCILIYSNTFSLERRLQLEGRIFRIGQHNNCEYIDYEYVDTIDEKIVASLKMKRNLLDYIRNVDDVKELVDVN